jgi:hypothetical protein
MERDPETAALLETARRVLREAVVPRLPPDGRYEALMVANALAIAARRLASGDRPAEEARLRLARIYGAPDAALAELERRLAADLRRGAADAPGDFRDAVLDHLWRTASDRAAESNPKALRPDPRRAP